MTSTRLLLSVLVLLPAAALAGSDISEELKDEIDLWNLCSRCYGEATVVQFTVAHHKAMKACMQGDTTTALPATAPLLAAADNSIAGPDVVRSVRNSAARPSSFLPAAAGAFSGRRRFSRQVDTGLLEPTPEDFAEFFAHAQKVKAGMQTKVGNLTCVLTKMGLLDASANVNLKHFTEDMWTQIGQNGGGKDPAFVQKMRDGFVDCYNIAQAWPQSNLDRNPLTKQWGRQMIFLKCAKKMELKTCSQLQLKEYIEAMYGPMDISQMPEFNGDKYEAAQFGMKVQMEKEEPEETMVRQFLWGNPNKAH